MFSRDYGSQLNAGADGGYTWRYDFPMLQKPDMIVSILMTLLLISSGLYVFLLIISFVYGNMKDMEDFRKLTLVVLAVAAGLLLLGVLAYLLLAAVYKGRFEYVYLMDRDGLCQTQTDRQLKANRTMGLLASAGGVSSGSLAATSAGLTAASRASVRLAFTKVKKIRPDRKRNYIDLRQTIQSMKVYAGDADFEFVKDFIIRSCPTAMVF